MFTFLLRSLFSKTWKTPAKSTLRERGIADTRVADHRVVSSGKESDIDNGVDLGPIPFEDQKMRMRTMMQ